MGLALGKKRLIRLGMQLAVAALIVALLTPWIALAGDRLALLPQSTSRQAGLEDSAWPAEADAQMPHAQSVQILDVVEPAPAPLTLANRRKGPSATTILAGLALLGILLTGQGRQRV